MLSTWGYVKFEDMYNLVVVVPSNKKGQETKKKIEEVVEKEAKLIKTNDTGERELAYPIGKETTGYYFWLDFSIDQKKLAQLREKIEEKKPLRYLIVTKPKEKPIEKKKKAKKEKPATRKRVVKKKKVVRPKKKAESEEKRMKDLDEKLEEIL